MQPGFVLVLRLTQPQQNILCLPHACNPGELVAELAGGAGLGEKGIHCAWHIAIGKGAFQHACRGGASHQCAGTQGAGGVLQQVLYRGGL